MLLMHDDTYIGRCSENNIKCVMHDDLGWKNQTTRYILPCFTCDFLSFIVVELIWFFHGVIQICDVRVPLIRPQNIITIFATDSDTTC